MGIFSKENMQKLLHNKFILLIGDSVQRSIYKDLIVLWHENRFVTDAELRKKGEPSFLGDKLVDRSELTNGVHYKEEREFKTDHVLIRFYFATRIYNDYIEGILKKYERADEPTPDVVLVNSCLWDISRYGKKGWGDYQKNIEKFCSRLDDIVPVETCIIWRTTLPVSNGARGGFITNDITNKSSTLPVDVLLANHLAHAVVTRHKYDVIDMHFMFTEQQQRRARDGIHWNMFAHRRMTNIVLTHVSRAWGLGVPLNPTLEAVLADFNQSEVSMNTTDVLKQAYPQLDQKKSPAVGQRESLPMQQRKPYVEQRMPRLENRKPTPMEERYGGPIRSTNEMFNMYSSMYYAPPVQESPVQQRKDLFRVNPADHHIPSQSFPQQQEEDYWSAGYRGRPLSNNPVLSERFNLNVDPYYFSSRHVAFAPSNWNNGAEMPVSNPERPDLVHHYGNHAPHRLVTKIHPGRRRHQPYGRGNRRNRKT